MINSVHLKNFQAHKDRKIEFTSGVNIIRGSSDAGKSAIIRAMICAITGKDFNAAYQTTGTEGAMEVQISIDNHMVTRGRTSKTNYYLVDDQKFSALRGACPDEVTKIFNMSADQLGSQYTPFFLLSDSSGEVARKIQAICDLDSIITISKKVNQQVKSASDDVTCTLNDINTFKTRLKELEPVEVLRKRFTRLMQRKSDLDEEVERLASYKKLLMGFAKLEAYGNQAAPAVLRPELEKCKASARANEKRASKLKELRKAASIVHRLSDQIETAKKVQSVVGKLSRDLESIQIGYDTFTKNNLRLKKWKQLILSIREWYGDYGVELDVLKNAKQELEDYKKEIGVCPVCGRAFND